MTKVTKRVFIAMDSDGDIVASEDFNTTLEEANSRLLVGVRYFAIDVAATPPAVVDEDAPETATVDVPDEAAADPVTVTVAP